MSEQTQHLDVITPCLNGMRHFLSSMSHLGKYSLRLEALLGESMLLVPFKKSPLSHVSFQFLAPCSFYKVHPNLMAGCSTGHIGAIGILLFPLTEPPVTLRSSYFEIEISLKAIHMFLPQKAKGDRNV